MGDTLEIYLRFELEGMTVLRHYKDIKTTGIPNAEVENDIITEIVLPPKPTTQQLVKLSPFRGKNEYINQN